MDKLQNIHPGEVLLEEFLIPMNISAYRLSNDIKIPQTRISEIIKGRRRITADTALRLSNYFGNSAKFWLGLQDDYDLEEALSEKNEVFKSIKRYKIKKIIIFSFVCFFSMALFGQLKPDSAILKVKAPESFKAGFLTTKGTFIIEAHRSWSPEGVDHLYQLIKTGFYNNNSIFRVQTGYVVQFGISDDKTKNDFWDKHPIRDEAVVMSNLKGAISYARDGADTRTVQLFINLKDNFKLDTVNYKGLRGFPSIAKIIDGFEVVESFYAGYGFKPANHQDSIMIYGNAYVKRHFPKVDYILSAEILEK